VRARAPRLLAFAFALAVPGVADATEPDIVRITDTEFRVRDERRDLVLGTGWTIGNQVYTVGSPNPTSYAPTLTGRFVVGSRRVAGLTTLAVAPLVPLARTVAPAQGGAMVEVGLALRAMPVNRRRGRFSLVFGAVVDQVRARSRVDLGDETVRVAKDVIHAGARVGNELAIVVVAPSRRGFGLDFVVASDIVFAFAVRSRLRFEDELGEVDQVHGPAELRVLGPLAGARVGVHLGIEMSWELGAYRRE
jgi:hypothetical protein